MELTNFTDVATEVTEVGESTDFAIDQESLGILFKGFSDGLYSNKIGSIVREITSNCFDSHVEAGITRPVTIEMVAPDPYTGVPGSISFIDYGVGLSPDRVKNIYSKYFASTKRSTNSQIGGFGIGAKTPLSYTESFMAITRYDNTEYVYIIHRGVKVPQIQLTEKNPTDKHNGTEIRVPIKTTRDFDLFQKEIKQQLMFFDNINYVNCGVDNNYKLYQGKHFIVRWDKHTMGTNRMEPCICLGKVRYPIDWNQINYGSFQFNTPVALRFDVGDLTVTMNRESIEYTDKVKDAINKKFEEVKREIRTVISTNNDIVEDFGAYIELASTKQAMMKVDKDIYVPVEGFADSSPIRYKAFKDFPSDFRFPSSDPFFQYELIGYISANGNLKKPERYKYQTKTTIHNLIKKNDTLFRVNGALGKRKNLYLHSLHGDFFLLRKNSEVKSPEKELGFSRSGFAFSDEVKQACEIYSAEVLKYLVEHSQSYDRTEVDEDWLKQYLNDLKDNTVTRDKTELYYRELDRYYMDSDEPKFRVCRETYADFAKSLKYGQMLIYGNGDDSDRLAQAGFIVSRINRLCERKQSGPDPKKVRLIKISKENFKYIQQLPQAIFINDVFKKLHRYMSLMVLRGELYRVFNDPDIIAHLVVPCFPRIARIYDEVYNEVSKVSALGSGDDFISRYIETNGYHPSVAHLAANIEKLQEWYSHFQLFSVLEPDKYKYSKDDEKKEIYAAIRKYANQTFKSILNY